MNRWQSAPTRQRCQFFSIGVTGANELKRRKRYQLESNGAKPCQTVSIGDTLCIIEAMKMLNQIEVEKSGKIVEILVENEQPVEFGQPLFVIE